MASPSTASSLRSLARQYRSHRSGSSQPARNPSATALTTRCWTGESLAELVARLSPVQQRVASAVADGCRAGWLDPLRWERYWRASDLSDEAVLGDAMTWLTRRQRAAGG